MSEFLMDVLPLVLCVATLALLLITGRSLRGTTLWAARWWAIAAMVAMLLVEFAVWKSSQGGGRQITLRFVAAAATFCPMMAVLGAKRPQHGPWQMIVLSLWCILALPAAESYFVRRGAAVQIHDVRGWFLWVLIGLGCLNYVGTRHGLASVIAAIGQVLLLSGHLPLVRRPVDSLQVTIGVGLLLFAMFLVLIRSRRRTDIPLSEQWTRFRDRFGTFWSFRVAERFNTQAAASSWPCRVGHFGFQNEKGEPNCEVPDEAKRLLQSLLARFESSEFEIDGDDTDGV